MDLRKQQRGHNSFEVRRTSLGDRYVNRYVVTASSNFFPILMDDAIPLP